MVRGAWWDTVLKSQAQLKQLNTHTHMEYLFLPSNEGKFYFKRLQKGCKKLKVCCEELSQALSHDCQTLFWGGHVRIKTLVNKKKSNANKSILKEINPEYSL